MATMAAIIKNSGELINSGIIDSAFWAYVLLYARLFFREDWHYYGIPEMGRGPLAVSGLSISNVSKKSRNRLS